MRIQLSGYPVLLLLSLSQFCWSFLLARQPVHQTQFSSVIGSFSNEEIQQQPATLAERIHLYQQAIESLTSLTTLPSCQRAVTDALLKSCDSLEESGTKEEHQLENVKTAYAIGLALCELNAATDSVPTACEAFLPSQSGQRSHDFQIQPCLQELSSSPQSWTSYSNNKQNAWKICHLSKLSTEQNEYLHKLQRGIESHALADSVFAEALLKWQQDLSARKAAAEELEVSSRESQDSIRTQWDEIRGKMQTEGVEAFHQIRDWLQEILIPQTQVKDELMSTATTLDVLRDQLAEFKNAASQSMNSILEQESSLATTRVTQHELARKDVEDLSVSISSLVSHDLARLSQDLHRHWNEQQHFHRMQRIQINELYNSTSFTMQNMARLKANLTDVVSQVHLLTTTLVTLDSVSGSLRTIAFSCLVIGAFLALWLFDRRLAAIVSVLVLLLNRLPAQVYDGEPGEALLSRDLLDKAYLLLSFTLRLVFALAFAIVASFRDLVHLPLSMKQEPTSHLPTTKDAFQIMQYDGETEQFFILDDFNQRSRPIFVE